MSEVDLVAVGKRIYSLKQNLGRSSFDALILSVVGIAEALEEMRGYSAIAAGNTKWLRLENERLRAEIATSHTDVSEESGGDAEG